MTDKKYNTEFFIRKSKETHGNKYDYSQSICNSCHDKVKIICSIHGEFEQAANFHISGTGCKLCGIIKNASDRALPFIKFKQLANEKFNNKFKYFENEYFNCTTVTKILCQTHGEFWQTPNTHLLNRKGNTGCKLCGVNERAKQRIMSIEYFIKKANIIHNNTYSYDLIKDFSLKKPITVICKIHNEFKQAPADHLAGKGCYQCGLIKRAKSKTYSNEKFIIKANSVHNNKYDYSKFNYISGREKSIIICQDHGEFFQTPEGHLSGRGCSQCVGFVSKIETKWLDCLNIPVEYRTATIKLHNGKTTRVDAFVPETNTVYEFHGDYWHGNPEFYNPNDLNECAKKSFGELYSKTLEKEKIIKLSGYNLIVIWEHEFEKY